MRLPTWVSQHVAALRALLVLTVILGLAYPLAMVGIAQVPGLRDNADGSLIEVGDQTVGSRRIGQAFTDAEGNPIPRYFQSRPSAAKPASAPQVPLGAGDGYDPTATSASNLGPEDVVDTDDRPSLLTQVCERSQAVADLEGVDGSRPYCAGGVGAVLGVFHRDGLTGPVTRAVSINQACPATPFLATYQGVRVECAETGADHTGAVVTPIRGDAPAEPVVPPDAVTASGSGLDPNISVAYARLQAPRVARERGVSEADLLRLVDEHTTGRALGFMGEPAVNVLELNLALDRVYPAG
jgi:K+-transporting ATPase ATPase C chain